VSKLRIASDYSVCGGQVVTAMAACSALGLKAGYLGAVGNDENGRRLQTELRRRGVDLAHLIIREAATRYAVILVEEGSGERIVMWRRDPRLDVDPGELTADAVAGARVVHVDGTDLQGSIAVARLARATAATVTCDIDTVTARTPELLAEVTIPILAEGVAAQLTGIAEIEPALRAMRRGHDGLLVVTLGDRGAAALDGDRFIHAAAVPVTAVDTTGAGDVFRAGFIYGLLQEWPIERRLRFANAAAAVACTRRGAVDGVPRLADLEPIV
jgi:sugar/nucleoside kinase (ribokinase family)